MLRSPCTLADSDDGIALIVVVTTVILVQLLLVIIFLVVVAVAPCTNAKLLMLLTTFESLRLVFRFLPQLLLVLLLLRCFR